MYGEVGKGGWMSLTHLRQGGFLIARIYQIAGRIFARRLREYHLEGITPSQGRILFALWQEDGISIRQLSVRTSLSKSTLTAMLDTLEAAGHVRRVPSQQDRREILIHLTAKDRSLEDSYLKVSEEMPRLCYRGFVPAEMDQFEAFLARILGNLEEEERREEDRP
jgi:DNA-binding MarR family transcriptional regulator